MKTKHRNNKVALAALIIAAGAATYTFIRTYKSIKRLENISLDISNDSVLSLIFNKD